MKIQDLAIIFVIIILPISLVLSAYAQYQIQTLNTQTLYDTQLTSATYDAIKAYQINAENSTTSELANSKIRDIEASISTFRNSIMSSFRLNGYTEEEIDNYIPALVYTMYDGFYIYSPYQNTEEAGNTEYGLKPYIPYSCRYIRGTIDVVITYALDNHITVQGTLDGINYINESGYLIDNIGAPTDSDGDGENDKIVYNGIDIEEEGQLKEYLYLPLPEGPGEYPYVKINGTKYYRVGNEIIYFLNGTRTVQCTNTGTGNDEYSKYSELIDNNNQAVKYYEEAKKFTDWLKGTDLIYLTYSDAVDSNEVPIWEGNETNIFVDNLNSIENELSNFNQHRLAVIRYTIESNLSVAIANYNTYSGSTNDFQMPKLKEDEWESITHNIALISFLQGLNIGGKIYNGYTIVTNSESKEVVLESNIYILGTDGDYHKIGDGEIARNEVQIGDSTYCTSPDGDTVRSAGRLNLDFKRKLIINSSNNISRYYYPLQNYNASYNSIIMQDDVEPYDDIYAYVNGKSDELKKAFYTALGRERKAQYKSDFIMSSYINSL